LDSVDAYPFTVVAADISAWSGRPSLLQLELRAGLIEVLEEACRAAALDRARWRRQDKGDEELALVPADVPVAAVVADLTRELGTALARYNRSRNHLGRMRLRVAMHHGNAHIDGTGFAGPAPVVASRLLDAQQLRQALNVADDADLALIVSDYVYEHAVRERYRGLDPDAFQRVQVEVKRFTAVAWVHVPGRARLDQFDARSPASPSSSPRQQDDDEPHGGLREIHGTNVFTGDVSVAGNWVFDQRRS
jgi:hypothetical protein